MARSKLTEIGNDLTTDSGSVLWSIVQGEQLEFPVQTNFIEDISDSYTYEAVIVEAEASGDSTPTAVKVNGVQTKLTVRVPTFRGVWDGAQSYSREEVVVFEGKNYKLLEGINRVSGPFTPAIDSNWEEVPSGTVYLQFPKTLSLNWSIRPTVTTPVYGFFGLRVTEPYDSIFQRTWKPLRGIVQILFSPTELVPD